MSSIISEDKVIRTIPFDGKHVSWHMWSRRFLAKAQASRTRDVLLGKVGIPKDAETLSTDESKEARKANVQVYTELLLSCVEEVCFGCVDTAKTTDNPEGDSKLAWQNLLDKYESKSETTKVELKRQYHASKLEKNCDPDVWITDLEKLRWRLTTCFSCQVDDDDVMIHVINNLSDEYDDMIHGLQQQMGASTDTLTLSGLREQLRSKYGRIAKKSGIDLDEKGLAVGSKPFKWACRNCGKIGHRAKECRARKRENSKGKNCTYCRRKGHEVETCYKKAFDENKSDDKKEAADSAKMDNTPKIKEEPDIGLMTDVILLKGNSSFGKTAWIADSGASVHMTNDKSLLFDVKESDSKVSVGNGESERVKATGKMKVEIKNSDGKILKVTLKRFVLFPLWYVICLVSRVQ